MDAPKYKIGDRVQFVDVDKMVGRTGTGTVADVVRFDGEYGYEVEWDSDGGMGRFQATTEAYPYLRLIGEVSTPFTKDMAQGIAMYLALDSVEDETVKEWVEALNNYDAQ